MLTSLEDELAFTDNQSWTRVSEPPSASTMNNLLNCELIANLNAQTWSSCIGANYFNQLQSNAATLGWELYTLWKAHWTSFSLESIVRYCYTIKWHEQADDESRDRVQPSSRILSLIRCKDRSHLSLINENQCMTYHSSKTFLCVIHSSNLREEYLVRCDWWSISTWQAPRHLDLFDFDRCRHHRWGFWNGST